MDAPVDLDGASRDERIALIGRLREQTADQEQQIARLHGEIATQRALMVRSIGRPAPRPKSVCG